MAHNHRQITHTTIWELNLINKKETNVKYNHRQMTHTTIWELKLIDKKKPILNIITDK